MKGGALKAKFYVQHMSENRLNEQKAEMCSTCKQVVGSCNMYPCVFEKWNYLCYFENSQVCYHTWHGSALCSTNGTLAGSQYQVRLEECFLSISLGCIRWGWRNSGTRLSNYWYVHNFSLFLFEFFQTFLLKCEFVLPTYLSSLPSLGVFTEAQNIFCQLFLRELHVRLEGYLKKAAALLSKLHVSVILLLMVF